MSHVDLVMWACVSHLTVLLSVATQLVEMELPEDKVLDKLNKVSTAKRQAYMVSELLPDDL